MPPRKSVGRPKKADFSTATGRHGNVQQLQDDQDASHETPASLSHTLESPAPALQASPQPQDEPTNDEVVNTIAGSPPQETTKKVKFKPRAAPRRTQIERAALEREEARRQASQNRSAFTPLGRDGRPKYGEQSRADTSRRPYQGPISRQWQASGVLGGDETREKQTRGRRGKANEQHKEGTSNTADQDVVMTSVEGEQKRTSVPQKKSKVKNEEGHATQTGEEEQDDQIKSTTSSKRKPANARTKVKKEVEQEEPTLEDVRWDDETGKRVDISHISLISSDEQESDDLGVESASKSRSKAASSRLLPVRLERHDHVDRALELNTDSSSLASAGLKRLNNSKKNKNGLVSVDEDQARQAVSAVQKREKAARGETVRERRLWRGAWQDDEDEEPFQLNEVSPPRKGGNEKEEDRQAHDSDSDDHMDIDEQPGEDKTSISQKDRQKQGPKQDQASSRESAIKGRPRKTTPRYLTTLPPNMQIPDPQTDEDLAEMIRMAQELQQDGTDVGVSRAALEASNIAYGVPSELKSNPRRENKVYLLQLPPIMPKLQDRDHPPSSPKVEKEEPRTDRDIKPDPDKHTLASDPVQQEMIKHADDVTTLSNPDGCPGTLTFFKSGAIKASWGGLELDVVESHRAGFGQEVLVHDYQAVNTKIEGQDRWEDVVDVGTEAYSMGQVEGGFVAGPDWEILLDE